MLTGRPALLAVLVAGMLSSCAPEPPPMYEANAGDEPQMSSRRPSRREDVCEIYHSMFPSSAIQSLAGNPDARISTRTEGGDVMPAELPALRAALIDATGGEGSHWVTLSEELLARAFRSWRRGPLPDCDWQGYALEISAPARNGRIGQVLTSDESGSYTRVSRPFFIDRDTAILLVRDVVNDGAFVRRKLVLTYRDGDRWAIQHPHAFEERAEAPQ